MALELLRHRARPPDRQRVGHLRRDRRPARVRRRPARALPVRRLRLEDRHARAAPGQPAAAAVGARRGHDQLDRAAEQGARRLPGRGPAAAGGAAGAADRQRDGLQPPRRWRRSSRPSPSATRSPRSSSTSRARTSRPGCCMGADPGETAALMDAVRPRTDEAADRQADAELRVAGRGRRGGRAARRRRRLARSTPCAGWRWTRAGRASRGSAAAPAACRARRSARSRSRRCARSASACALPIVGMGGVQTGRHARDLLDAGADLVGSGPSRSATRSPGPGSRPSCGG